MREQSKNKCYSEDIDKEFSSKRYLPSYPKTVNDTRYIRGVSINKLDTFSDTTTATLETNYCANDFTEDEEKAMYGTVDPLVALSSYASDIKVLIDGIRTQIDYDKIHKCNYKLLSLVLSKDINHINLFCKGLASDDIDNPMHGRYIIVVSGYQDNRCKIHYEVITYHNYCMHPTRILSDIEKKAKSQNLKQYVNIDETSFANVIKQLKTNNPLNNEDQDISELEVIKALDLIDKKVQE